MIGYDAHGQQYPQEWDEPEFKNIFHSDLSLLETCDGEIEEYTEKPDGWPERVFYRCTKCHVDVTSEVINADRDSADWEYDYEA